MRQGWPPGRAGPTPLCPIGTIQHLDLVSRPDGRQLDIVAIRDAALASRTLVTQGMPIAVLDVGASLRFPSIANSPPPPPPLPTLFDFGCRADGTGFGIHHRDIPLELPSHDTVEDTAVAHLPVWHVASSHVGVAARVLRTLACGCAISFWCPSCCANRAL
jgi:hypothetical protein